jgi:predicted kinase
MLVLMAGLSGSGKTTLASAIGRRMRWPVLDKDSIKAPLLELGASEELAGQASYVVMYQLARDLLVSQGFSLVLDTPTSYPRALQAFSEIAAEAGAALRIILCEADVTTRRVRLQTRESRVSQPADIGLQAGDGRITYDDLPSDTLTLDTTRPIDELVDEAVQYILTA